MKKSLSGILIVAVLASCQTISDNKRGNVDTTFTKPESNTNVNNQTASSASLENCYRYVAQRDTYDIKITRNGELSHGTMHFNNFEKDDSKGTFAGTIVTANIIKAIYKFESEGMKSTREIFLRDEGDQLVTGIGVEDVKGDSAFVKNPDKISFTGAVFKKVNCSAVE